jgi:proteic killer suppression protein
MVVDSEDNNLQRLFEEPEFRLPRLGSDLTRAFRKVVGIVRAAADERDLYSMQSLHFERLEGDRAGQRSLRLNRQWRLVVRLETVQDVKRVVVIEIINYH